MKTSLKFAFLLFLSIGPVTASLPRNEWVNLMDALTYDLQSFVKSHGGQLPQDLSELGEIAFADKIGSPISSKVSYFRDIQPSIRQPPVSLLAMTSFLILSPNLGQSQAMGRYIITRDRNGQIEGGWEYEQNIQVALVKAGLTSPPSGPMYEEKEFDPFLGATLLEDALARGVSKETAAPIIDAYVKEFQAGQVKKVTTWAEIAPRSMEQTGGQNTPTPALPSNSNQTTWFPTAYSTSPLTWLLVVGVIPLALGFGIRFLRRK